MGDHVECPTCGCEGWNGVTNCAIEERDRLAAELAECGRVAGEALGTEPSLQGNPSQGVVKALADWAGQLCEDKERLAAEVARIKPVVEAVKRIADKAALGDQCDCAVCNAIRANEKAEGRE